MPSPAFLVVQQREYRRHLIEVIDRGRASCAVVVRPPPSMGEAWEVVRGEGAAVTLAEMLDRAKALIDAAMGPRPPQRAWHGGTRRGP